MPSRLAPNNNNFVIAALLGLAATLVAYGLSIYLGGTATYVPSYPAVNSIDETGALFIRYTFRAASYLYIPAALLLLAGIQSPRRFAVWKIFVLASLVPYVVHYYLTCIVFLNGSWQQIVAAQTFPVAVGAQVISVAWIAIGLSVLSESRSALLGVLRHVCSWIVVLGTLFSVLLGSTGLEYLGYLYIGAIVVGFAIRINSVSRNILRKRKPAPFAG